MATAKMKGLKKARGAAPAAAGDEGGGRPAKKAREA